jgi:serine/threonine protein phosphatase PrpC
VGESLPYALAAVATRVGSTHTENQDSYQVLDGRTSLHIRDLRRGALYAVADGVSTLEMGRWAAETTCARLAQFFQEDEDPTLETLKQLIGEIDWELRGQGKGRAACTLCALWLHGGDAHVLHVGDSVVYLLRDGAVLALTGEHAGGRRLRAYMGMGPDIAEVLGAKSERFRPGDVFLLATDGVSGLLGPDVLLRHWTASRENPDRCARAIVGEIDARGGADDATLVIVHVLMEEDFPEERTDKIRLAGALPPSDGEG